MPKELKVHPNERIDIPDFNRAASDFTAERVAFEAERGLLDRRSRVLSGFRIQIEDQAANPGQITVFNGYGLDRDGNSLHDEDQANTSVTLTLSGAGTSFYIEVELVESDTDTDARAFWDGTKTNVSPIPDGGEASLTVATRVTPTWRVVQPVSTTGFDSTTNPNSTRIPLAVLSTDGSNVIDGSSTPGLVQVDAASVTEEAITAGATSIRVFDSILLGSVGDQVILGFGLGTAETVTLTANDLDNGIISFGATVNAHDIGEIVQAVGTGRLMQEKSDPNDTANHPDNTPRMFSGDEVRGGALLQSKDSLTERDDLNIRAFKDKVDATDALFRELKFGSFDPATSSTAPPSSFASRPRYFDSAGSIAGARTNSVSVGNGTTSWGDFNGTTQQVFQDAIDSLPATGGTIFVKRGTYTFASSVTVTDKPVHIVGEGYGVDLANNISTSASTPMFAVDSTAGGGIEDYVDFGLAYLTVTQLNTSETIASGVDVTFLLNSIDVVGSFITAATGDIRVLAKDCKWDTTSATQAVLDTTAAASTFIRNSSLIDCVVTGAGGYLVSGEALYLHILGGRYTVDGLLDAPSGLDIDYVSIQDAWITSTTNPVFNVVGTLDYMTVSNCRIESSPSALTTPAILYVAGFSSAQDISFLNCQMTYTAPSAGEFDAIESNTTISGLTVENCQLNSLGGGGTLISIPSGSGSGITVRGNNFLGDHVAVLDHDGTYGIDYRPIVIEDNYVLLDEGDVNLIGVDLNGTGSTTPIQVSVRNNHFIADASADTAGLNDVIGVRWDGDNVGTLVVDNNFFDLSSPTSGASTDLTKAVHLDNDNLTAHITNNRVEVAGNANAVDGIYVSVGEVTVVGNDIVSVSTVNASGSAYGIRALQVNNGICLIKDNTTFGIDGSANNSVYGIYTSSNDLTQIIGNAIDSMTPTASATSAWGIRAGGDSEVIVANNTISMEADLTKGIYVINTDEAVSVQNNLVDMGANSEYGIHVFTASSCEGWIIANNEVTGLTDGTGIRAESSASSGTANCLVSNNVVIEAAFAATNRGIHVTVVGSCCLIEGNMVNGVTGGAVDRSGFAASAGISGQVTTGTFDTPLNINNNVVNWGGTNVDATGIYWAGETGGIVGNTVTQSDAGGLLYDIDSTISGDCIVIGNNVRNGDIRVIGGTGTTSNNVANSVIIV